MRLFLPLLVTFLCGMLMILQFFIPHRPFSTMGEGLSDWYMIVASASIFLGVVNLVQVHAMKIARRAKNWQYSPVVLAGFFAMVAAGFAWGVEEGRPFDYMFQNMVVPMGATMFSLLAFFVASAAFRAFRSSNWRATLLLLSAFIVMLGRVPIGDLIWGLFPGAAEGAHPNLVSEVAEWLMQVPNMAGQRAVMIGAALGVVATSLRMIFGIERSYLGGAE
ncbi:MAG: hypothetical protein QUS11_07865 [Candidatus Fermentibacter sp.]|nr:hypothetical protein [Candidatus Fermentibacter sp.]